MKTIFKYQLETVDEQTIEMPLNSEILTVQIQNGVPCVWALVNTELKNQQYKFRIFGTGHTIEEGFRGKYVGTYQLPNRGLVFHVYQQF